MSEINSNIIFTIGRMNPPTTGHMKLIERMIVTALDTNVKKIYIILSATVDNEKNPLECIDKQKLLLNFVIDKVKTNIIEKKKYDKTEINKLIIEIICMNDPRIKTSNSILQTILFMIQQNNPSNIQLIIGEDRIKDYKWITKYLPENVNFAEPIDVKRPGDAISATKIRNMAISGHFDEFSNEMKDTGIDDNNILEIYDSIRNKIVPKSSKSRKTKSSKKTRAGKKTYKKSRFINIYI